MTDVFGAYEVLELVATGSTGTVYRCRHSGLERVAAVKELSAGVRSVPGLLERFRGEAWILSTLDHPHVVALYDYVEDGDRAWLAEQWVSGASLEAILIAHGPLTAEQSLGVMRGALMGLAHAHDRGLVHRDIAPGNILADMQGTSMLVDFGLAAPVGGTDAVGTPAYISPEAARSEPYGKSADVYSAAAVLFALLSGHPPFPAADPVTMLRRHVQDPPPALSGHGADLADLVRRCLDKDPSSRPADAGAFLLDLEEAARRRFGAAWLERASIAGVVASVAAAGAAGVGAVGVSTGAAAGAPTVVIDTAARAGATAVRRAARFSRGALVAAGTAAVLAVAGVAFGVAAITDDGGGDSGRDDRGGTTAERGASASPTPTPTPTPPTFTELAPSGGYTTRLVVVSSTYEGEAPGQTTDGTWTLASTCEVSTCTGTINSSTGRSFTYSWDGAQLVFDGQPPEIREGLCVDNVTGEEQPGSHFKETTTRTWTPFTASAPASSNPLGPPDSLVSTQTAQSVYSELSEGCTDDIGVLGGTYEFTITRQAAAASPVASPSP